MDRLAEIEQRTEHHWYIVSRYSGELYDANSDVRWLIAEIKRLRLQAEHYGHETTTDLDGTVTCHSCDGAVVEEGTAT